MDLEELLWRHHDATGFAVLLAGHGQLLGHGSRDAQCILIQRRTQVAWMPGTKMDLEIEFPDPGVRFLRDARFREVPADYPCTRMDLEKLN